MEANELRIGSTYLSTKFNTPVTLTAEDIFQMVADADGAEIEPGRVVKPIPLTVEWLVNLGFSKESECYEISIEKPYVKFHEGHYMFRTMKTDYGWWFILDNGDDGINLGTFHHVHQLQNLYFALTGEELTIEDIS